MISSLHSRITSPVRSSTMSTGTTRRTLSSRMMSSSPTWIQLDAGLAQLAHRRAGELAVLADQHVAGVVLDLARAALADQVLGVDLLHDTSCRRMRIVSGV